MPPHNPPTDDEMMQADTAKRIDPTERARRAMASRYPGAEFAVNAWRGKPVVVAREGNLIRLVRHRR
jgi:hypothetical protein